MVFATQFVFYLMVLFVRAANKGKVTQWQTPRVFYIFSTLSHYSGSSLELCERSLMSTKYNNQAYYPLIFHVIYL